MTRHSKMNPLFIAPTLCGGSCFDRYISDKGEHDGYLQRMDLLLTNTMAILCLVYRHRAFIWRSPHAFPTPKTFPLTV